jgi:uncharacterized repeat protein (TIGR02543 family)
MKTNFLHPIRRLYITAAAFLAGIAGAQAYDYTGYDYVEEFPQSSGYKGTIASYIAVNAGEGSDYLLAFTGTGSGSRNGTFTLTSPVSFTQKAVVEFDWYPAAFGGGAGTVGQITFRKGTTDADVLFSVYNPKDRTALGFTLEPLTGGYHGALTEATRHELTDAPLSAWYHVKAVVDILNNKVSFGVTGITNTSYSVEFEISYPQKTWSGTSVANIYFNGDRCCGTAISWATKIDNLGIKVLDTFGDPTESISIAGASAVSKGQSISLTASVLPVTAAQTVTWSIQTGGSGVVTIDSSADLACTVTGSATATGTDTVVATATDGSGVVAKHAVKVTGTLVNAITIGGDNQLKTFYLPSGATATLNLTATVGPDTAENKAYTWSSSNTSIAGVTTDGVVTITSPAAATSELVTITATANDDGQFASSYAFYVDNNNVTSAAYDYTGYGYIDLFSTGDSYKNGAIVTNPARGATWGYDATNLWLTQSLSNSNLGRRQYYTLNKVVEATQKLVVEFDWYAVKNTGGTDVVEIQTTFIDAYAVGSGDPAAHEIFTIYHVEDVENAFGLVAGPLYSDATLTDRTFGGTGADGYYASRSGANAAVDSRRLSVTAPLSVWYHIKAEIDIANSKIKFTVTKATDGAAIAASEWLSLPNNFSMVDGVGRLLNSAAGTGSGCTFSDRLDNLAIKRADVFTPGKKVEEVSITQLDNLTTVIIGKTTQLRAAALPVDAETQKLAWSSLKPEFATVSATGLVTGLTAGKDSTVGIVATATDGSNVADTFYIDVIPQPVTGITISGLSTYPVVSLGAETATLTAVVTPADAFSKELAWTTASKGAVAAIQSVNATTDTITVLFNAMGADTIIATATDKAGFTARHPIAVILNPYPGYGYVETFDAGLNGAVQGLRGGPTSVTEKDANTITDRVLQYWESNGARRAGAYNFTPAAISFTRKAIVEFDVSLQAKNNAGEGIISFMSGVSPNSDDNHDVFSLYVVNDATGFGVSAGYITRNAYSSTSYYEYVDAPRGVQASVAAANRGWVTAPIGAAPTSSSDVGVGVWYHVKALIYVGERIDFIFSSDADTFRVTLPTPAGLKTSIGGINMATVNEGSSLWHAVVDNVGIRVADSDPDIPATGVKVSSAYSRVAAGGGVIPVTAAVLPWDVSAHAVTWGVVDPAVATVAVEAGNPLWVATLTGGNRGIAEVFAKVNGTALSDTLRIPVETIMVDSFYIQGSTSVSVGHSITITKSNSEVWPSNAGNKSVTWTASNANVSLESNGDTCIVTGVNAGENERDSVLIIATADDGGGAADTIKVYVNYTHLTRIDLGGNRRVFYADAPAGTTIALTPIFTPSTASDREITSWESADTAILTVDGSTGVATLAGGYGKAAVKVTAHDGDLTGYYYVEVAPVSANPYDEFEDFESPMHNDATLKLDTFAFFTNGFSASRTTFRNTGAIYGSVSGVSGGRGLAAQFVNAPLTGERIILRFDFFAGKTGGSSAAQFTYGSISIKDNSTAPASGNVNGGYVNSILSIVFIPDTVPGQNFLYYTGNDLFNVAYPGDVAGLPGTQENRDASNWGFLPALSTLDAWYTLEATIDNYLHTVSFTITELDAPERTAAVANVPFSSTFDPTVGSIYIFVRRESPNSASLTTAVDNFGYKSIASGVLQHISITLNPDGGTFTDDEGTTSRVLSGVADEPLVGVPEVSRVGYTFVGWYNGETEHTPATTYSGNVTLTAKWDVRCYTVRYEGVDLPDTCVNYGTSAVRPADPERECYEFGGWYYLKGTVWSYTTTITDSVTIVAQWTEIEGCNEGGSNTSVASGVLSGVALYPNPASDVVTLTGLTGGETIEVIGVSGTLLLSRKATGDKEAIDVASLPSGAYLVRVAKGSATKQLKLVKN